MGLRQLCISVEGGGALGIGPLAFLCRLEQDLGKKICDITTAFAGTSTGSIIAGGLDEGFSAHDLFDLYKSNLSKIFTKYPVYKRILPSVPTYDNSNLKKILKDTFNGKVSDWKKPIYIATTHMNGESVEKVWDLGDKNTDKWFAILTSCSAPTYFNVIVKDGQSYCDGGLWANNPTDLVLAGQFKQGNTNIKILNLNTGMNTPNKASGDMTLLDWGKYIIGDWTARSSKSPIYEAKAILGDDNVFNASPKYNKKINMDKTDEKTLNKIVEIWIDYYESVRKDLLNFINKN